MAKESNLRVHPPSGVPVPGGVGGGPIDPAKPGAEDAVIARVRKVLDLIRPAVQADGGDIELVGITAEKTVQIRMHGACVDCPSSTVTLQTGIARNLKQHVPEVKGVEAVD
ncbi:MAG: NifU family protein [Phycisphaerales bacterium]|nr:NifU family protein [Phycisphaerales bacterium]